MGKKIKKYPHESILRHDNINNNDKTTMTLEIKRIEYNKLKQNETNYQLYYINSLIISLKTLLLTNILGRLNF